jgi:proteasome lid subunit RPN8/RPN11
VRGTVFGDIVTHARRAAPEECCGLLIGSRTHIESAHPARNLCRSPTRYLVDPADHFAAIRSSRQAGLAVVGAYHSHPASGALASPTDEDEATGPNFLYLIVSLLTTETRGFRLVNGRMQGVMLREVPDAD